MAGSAGLTTGGTSGSPTYGQLNGQQGTYPFGESWYSSNGNQFVFTTYQRDSQTGLDYAMARYYDSGAARFCSADPVGGNPDDPQSWNRYAYARNDPVDITDPNGQFFGFLIALFQLLEHFLAAIGAGGAGGGTALGASGASNLFYLPAITGTTAFGGGQAITITTTLMELPAVSTTGSLIGGTLAGGLAGGTVAAGALAGGLPQTGKQQPLQQAKSNCPPVPVSSNNLSQANSVLKDNYRATVAAQETAAATHSSTLGWFFNKVKPGGPWDFKSHPKLFPGGWRAWDDFGNFNYGAIGTQLGLSERALQRGAVLARLVPHPIRQLWNYGLGNDPRKSEMIHEGAQYTKNNCGPFGSGG